MPILLKAVSQADVFHALDMPADLLDWMVLNSVTMTVYTTELRLDAGPVSAAVSVKTLHLLQIKDGTLGELARKALKMSLVAAVKQLQKKVEVIKMTTQTVQDKLFDAEGLTSVMDQLPPIATAPQVAPSTSNTKKTAAWTEFPLSKLKSATPVQLAGADRLYQPVRGSSPSSRYFLVAGNADLRIAARLKGTSLSIRIEGPNYDKHKASIQACGFGSVGDNYASLHLDTSSLIDANKALGAVLLGLGVKLETPLPDLSLLQDKGA